MVTVNTTGSKVAVGLLYVGLVAAVIAVFVAASMSTKPVPDPTPPVVTRWNCSALDPGQCVANTAVGAEGYVTKDQCLAACNARTGYNCEIGTDGWPTGKCIPSKSNFTFATLKDCQDYDCGDKNRKYTVQCVEDQGCVPTDGAFPGPVWNDTWANAVQNCNQQCVARHKCTGSPSVCSPPVITWDSNTYPIQGSCDDRANCNLPANARYKWTGTTCQPVVSATMMTTTATTATATSAGAGAGASDCLSATYPSFDECMQQSCSKCTQGQFATYCKFKSGGGGCARSNDKCCDNSVCLNCESCSGGFCRDTCSSAMGIASGCRGCKRTCKDPKDMSTCVEECTCKPFPDVQQVCEDLCACDVINDKGDAAQKLCHEIVAGDKVISCTPRRFDPKICDQSQNKGENMLWCIYDDLEPISCQCYPRGSPPPSCPKEYPDCNVVSCM